MKTYLDLFFSWFKMGLFTFGGGYAMLPMIQKEVIEKHHWATEEEVMDYYAIGQCTPGIIAVNTATFVGKKIKGVPGAIAATLGILTPSLIIITVIAGFLTNFQDIPVVQHALGGIRISVCVLMCVSIAKMFKKNVLNRICLLIFAAAFLLAYFTDVSTILLVVAAAVCGILLYDVDRTDRKKEGE